MSTDMKTILLSRLFLLLGTLLMTGDSAPIYSPTFQINLNCGSSSDTVDQYDSRTWTGDINSKFFPKEVGSTSQVAEAPRLPTSGNEVPYATARLSYSEFTYRFPVSPGQKFIRLYFFSISYNGSFSISNSLFSVKAGGYRLLKDFNVSLSSTDYDGEEAFVREYCINFEPEEKSLNITFTPSNGAYAFINGIEIMSMPTNLYHSADAEHEASYLGHDTSHPIENNTALEMIYRINVGVSQVSPNEDTGMYRTWFPDELYLDEVIANLTSVEQEHVFDLHFGIILNYTAPAEVYRIGRTIMRPNQTINRIFSLTWGFPVDPSFSYLVRLHFCEVARDITKAKERIFQIFIANSTAEIDADIVDWSTRLGYAEGNRIPIYRDYFVPLSSLGNQQKWLVNLSIELQANQDIGPLLNGLEIFKLNGSDGNLGGPFKELQTDIQPKVTSQSSKPSKKKSTPMLALLAGAVSGLLVLSIVGFLIFRRKRKVDDSSSSKETKWGPFSFSTTKSTKSRGSALPSDLCRHFSLAEIKAATQNFNSVFIIGFGGFGNVYKGYIDGGSTPVAIKRLKPESSQGAHEFKNEIEMLSQLRHLHLVSLVGYCTDQGEMILVYDYMSSGTLRDHLYHTDNPPLPWEQRLQICIGAARGLHYLHTGAKCMIIHRDVKSTNILLDEKWVAKVSDFGLSKMGTTTMSKTHISTMVKGSFGYLDPEYYRRQQLTEKSDVYSFGVVLCEVLCARPALIRTVEKKQMSLAEWTKSCHRNGSINQIIDPNLRGKIAATSLNKFVELAVSCMNDNGNERPSMNDVVWRLEFALQLQQSAEVLSDVKMEGEDEVAFMKSNDDVITCSWECSSDSRAWTPPQYSSDSKTSRTTKTSNGDLSTTNESITGMSGTIFSEIRDPTLR